MAAPVNTVAVGMNPSQLTQEFTDASPLASGSVILELGMSVGVPWAGKRVSNTPATTARRPACVRAGAVAGNKPKRKPACKVGTRVVVERKFIDHQVHPSEPARNVLDTNNRQDYTFYGFVKGQFDLFPSNQPPVEVTR